jgi:ribosomal protein L32
LEATAQEDGEPRFDVRARRGEDCPLEGLQDRLVERARLPPAKAKSLFEALQSAPSVVLGRGVSRERADRALMLSKAGLVVEISPVLRLAPKLASDIDGRVECPACGEVMVPGPHRQCAHCGVYIDKVSPEQLMRRKLRKQEQVRMDARLLAEEQREKHRAELELEERLRREIRKELEARHGLNSTALPWRRWPPQLVAGGGIALAGLGFAVGWFVPHGGPSLSAMPVAAATANPGGSGQDLDRLLARLDRGEQGPSAGGRPPTVQWAIEAADSFRPSDAAPPQPPEQLLATSFGRVEGLSTVDAGAAWPVELVPSLRADLAVALAESGQLARADELLQALEPWRASVDPRLTEQVRRARLLVRAWALRDHGLTTITPLLTQLNEGLRGIVDPIERASLLSEVVPVMARTPAVPDDVIASLIRQTGAAVKAVADDGPRRRLTEAWIVAEARVLLARAEHEAVSGHFSRLRTRLSALAALQPQTTEPATLARLLAMQVRIS